MWERKYGTPRRTKGVSRREALWTAFIRDPSNLDLKTELEALLAHGERVEDLLPEVWEQLCRAVHDDRFRDTSADGVVHVAATSAVTQRSQRVMVALFKRTGFKCVKEEPVSDEDAYLGTE